MTVAQQIMVMVRVALASVGAAGIPGSELVMLTSARNAVNLPLEIIEPLGGIDRVLNMAHVIPNIVGDVRRSSSLKAKVKRILNWLNRRKNNSAASFNSYDVYMEAT
ncbi:MAG: cation:dicarboxylase symporter family transporter [Oscillibacter sp.]|nr:cation:dicarboxylase symporter family transporter [Oscillibacter sp.]